MYDNYKDSAENNLNYQDMNFIDEKALLSIKEITDKLPFELTKDQKKAIWGLLKNYSIKKSSKNLIFGDVGSGKTMVALIVNYVLLKMGYQSVIMAPTSLLAKQHYNEAIELIGEKYVFLIHSKSKKKEKDAILKVLSEKKPCIIYGTSSVNSLEFTNLKSLFIDEEQKFGVATKEKLQHLYKNHIGYMTATPIPRTLASSMYSDFKIHKIEEKPAMQKERKTKISYKLSNEEIAAISNKMRNGEQMLVIVPAIASNDLVSAKSALIKYKKLFPEFKIDTINGRMTATNIEKNTESFMSGEINILVATTMVDAGFSNKNLSFVFIENAERFGLAQMHQIRGRCGRAEKQGYCYLVPLSENLKELTRERLHSLVNSENGFELSMKDIELRGSGDLRGSQQTGSDVNMLDWLEEIEEISTYLKNNPLM
jgi:ATP-dependent DNA helicase RecG